MGTSRQLTERQLQAAQAALQTRVQTLQQKGLDAGQLDRDPLWRQLDAKVRQIRARLRKVVQVESLNAELGKLKVENQAKKAAEKAAKKAAAAGEKKPKGGKEKGKEKGKGEEKAAKKEKSPPKPKKEKEQKE